MEAKQPVSSRFAGAMLPQASSAKPGAKKLVIKQYAEKPKLPESFDADTWARLSGAVAALLQQSPANHSFEELYAASFFEPNLCITMTHPSHYPTCHSQPRGAAVTIRSRYKDCEDRCSQAANLAEETRSRLSGIIASYAESVVAGQV
jgi:hypothetical protein